MVVEVCRLMEGRVEYTEILEGMGSVGGCRGVRSQAVGVSGVGEPEEL